MTESDVRGITLQHPWAFAIAHLNKRVENRTWKPRNWQHLTLAIHGGVNPEGRALESTLRAINWVEQNWSEIAAQMRAEDREHVRALGKPKVGDLITTGIVAVARITHVSAGDVGLWQVPDQYHWHLDVVTLPDPIPHRGGQGLWTLKPEAEETVRAVEFRVLA